MRAVRWRGVANSGVGYARVRAVDAGAGQGTVDSLTALILAIPGTIIGIADIRVFRYPLPEIGVPLGSIRPWDSS